MFEHRCAVPPSFDCRVSNAFRRTDMVIRTNLYNTKVYAIAYHTINKKRDSRSHLTTLRHVTPLLYPYA
jgi:hypothetical protein